MRSPRGRAAGEAPSVRWQQLLLSFGRMPARFQVHDVFEISGRGRVVSGNVLEGKIQVGMRAVQEGTPGGQRWLIAGVEFADNLGSHEHHVALVLPHAPSLVELRAALQGGSVLLIEHGALGE